MPYTRADKAKDVAIGVAQGGATTTVVGTGLAVAVKGLGAVAPRAARVIKAAASARAALAVGFIGATYGAIRAVAHGENAIGGAVAGSVLIFPDFAQAQQAKKKAAEQPPPADAATNVQYNTEAAAYARQKASEAEKGSQDARIWAARADAYEAKVRELATKSEPKNGQDKSKDGGYFGKVWSDLFGEPKPSPYDEQRTLIKRQIQQAEGRLQQEFGGSAGSGKKGAGPKTKEIEGELARLRGELSAVDKKERESTEATRQLYQSAGAVIGGSLAGSWLGANALKSAKAAVKSTEASIKKVTDTAKTIVNSSPKSVISGTVAGDKAKAAITAAQMARTMAPVSKLEAFGLPAVLTAQGAGVIAYSQTRPHDDPVANAMRIEGTAALTAGIVGAKYGVQAIALRPKIAPQMAANLDAAANRIAREAKTGPAAVAQMAGRRKSAVAKANAVQAEGLAAVATVKAKTAPRVAEIAAGGRVAAARMTAQRPAIESGTKTAIAKTRGAAAVERAQIVGKAGNARAIAKANGDGRYKDVWQDSRGRTYHRKDQSVRKRKDTPAANDNRGPVLKAR